MKKRKPSGMINARAKYDYQLEESFLAGVILSGAEAKSIRMNRVSMKGAFVTIKSNEAWLNNMQISPMHTNAKHLDEQTQTRARKLLLKRRELEQLQAAKQQGRTIVPTEILTNKYIKVRIAIGKGKKNYDKRESIKKRTQNRDAMREIARNR